MQSISWLPAALAAALLAAPVVGAEVGAPPRAVLELFTSQGCSSCPKADALLQALNAQPDLITLAYHVDYWDYIGWTDTFGAKENSDLQKAYAQSWGSSRIYTPQLVVNGISGVVGSRDKDVNAAVTGATLAVPVALTVASDMLEIAIAPQAGGTEAVVWLITFKDHAAVTIERGENAGQTVDYTQIVTGRQMLGMWDPKDGTNLKLPLSALTTGGANGAVILLQAEKSGLPGAILGAGSVKL